MASPNSLLGFPRKPGVFSEVQLTGVTGDNGFVSWSGIGLLRGSAFSVSSSGGATGEIVYYSIDITEPGLYAVTVCGVANSGAARQVSVVRNQTTASSAIAIDGTTITSSVCETGRSQPLSGTFVSDGEDQIRVAVSSNISADPAAFFRITKIN